MRYWGWMGCLFLFFLVSCASTPPNAPSDKCDPGRAAEDGFSRAMHGQRDDLPVNDPCDETLHKNFEEGYSRGLDRYCDAAHMEDSGRARGLQGDATVFPKLAYQVCPNLPAMQTFFEMGRKEGLADFCEANTAELAGAAVGAKGKAGDFPAASYQLCGENNLGMVKTAFARGYQRGLAIFCSKDSVISAEAFIEGREGADKADIVDQYHRCSAPLRQRIQGIYEDNYNKGLAGYCSPTAVENDAKEAAKQSTATGELPEKYHRCLGRFPQISDEYSKAFGAAGARSAGPTK